MTTIDFAEPRINEQLARLVGEAYPGLPIAGIDFISGEETSPQSTDTVVVRFAKSDRQVDPKALFGLINAFQQWLDEQRIKDDIHLSVEFDHSQRLRSAK